jgi:hypothetical protein
MLGELTIRADIRRGQQPMIWRMPVPVLVLLGGFLFYPLVYGIGLSVHDGQGADAARFVGIEHFARAVLGDAVFHRSLLNTVLFTGAAVVLQTGTYDPAGRVLRAVRPGVGRRRCGLEVPVCAVFRRRGFRGSGIRRRHIDDRAARG